MRKRVGVIGLKVHQWLSLNKTFRFYAEALQPFYELVYLDVEALATPPNLACLISVDTAETWQRRKHWDFPILYMMNGGSILDQPFLYDNLTNLEASDGLIVNCRSDVAILKNMFASASPSIHLLPLPVRSDTFRALNKLDCRNFLSLPKVDHVLGFTGRLLPQKNLHRFLYFAAALKSRLKAKRIVGIVNGKFWADYPVLPYVTDEYPQRIKHLIKELNLEKDLYFFSGDLSEDELCKFYDAMDLLIHPTHSLDENFGYTPLEAMACGVPVIGTAYGGLKDTILSGVTGFLMKTWVTKGGIRMDVESGVQAAEALLSNTSQRKRFS